MLLAALACAAGAQTLVGPVPISGTTNVPYQVNWSVPTNSVAWNFQSKTLTVSGIANTNEYILLSWGWELPGSNVFIQLGTVSNNFAAGTNNGSWTNVIPQTTYYQPLVPYAQAVIGSLTNAATTYTNNAMIN